MTKHRPATILAIPALIAVVACLDVPTQSAVTVPRVRAQQMVGDWVVHIDGGSFRNSIELFRVDTTSGGLTLHDLQTRDWAGEQQSGLGIVWSSGTVVSGGVSWALHLADGSEGQMSWSLVGDTVFGRLSFPGSLTDYALVGVPVSLSIVPKSTGPVPAMLSPQDRVPLVLLRVDDLPAQDRDFIPRLMQRGLYGELAIPTALVGMSGRASWSDVAQWHRDGFAVAAHSRNHSRTNGSPQIFLSEVVGSLSDLANRGCGTTLFVQPGTWEDSIYFDTPEKLNNWRGAVLQTFATVFEGYARPASVSLPMADSMAMGVGHFTVSNGAPVATVLNWWQEAQRPARFTVFMMHSWSLTSPDQLDWFLDSLALAMRGGRIRLAHSSAEALYTGR